MPEPFTFDLAAQRFRAADGRFVADQAIRGAVDTVIDGHKATVRALSERLTNGGSLAEWEQGMLTSVKQLHLATAMAGHGGAAQMSAADYGWVGQRIRAQYEYVRGFAADIASGRQSLTGVAARADLYSDAARATFTEMIRRDARLRGADTERWLLRAADHCAGCVAQAAKGEQPAGTLPSIGSQNCRSRCRCHIQSRRTEAA